MSENHNSEKWTEVEHLPQWDEEFYNIFTAKKYGKWVMMKTLKPEYRDLPEYQDMIEKEFDVRYNLAHPNIVMINDFEDVPGVGRCIITDDVYGESLRTIIDKGKLGKRHLDQILHQMVSAMSYIQSNHIVHHPLSPERIIFTENIENIKLIDVGFDQKKVLTCTDVSEDIYKYGQILKEVLDASNSHDAHLRSIVNRCVDPNPKKRFRSVEALRLAIEGRSPGRLYMLALAFLLIMVAILVFINYRLVHHTMPLP